MKNFDQFHDALNKHNPDAALSQQDASAAFHNLSGFMSLLLTINEREQIVPTKPERSKKNDNQ
jgi:hypothetical protein